MVDDNRLSQIEEGMRDAAQSTTDLRLSVESLSLIAGEVATLQRQQVETRKKAEAADQKADQIDLDSAERWSRGKRVGILVAGGLLLLFLLASFLSFRSAVLYVQDLTQQVESRAEAADIADRQTRYAGCTTRNKAVQVQADRERRLSKLPEINPAEGRIHAGSAVELERLVVDCEQYRRAP
jgi:hypothetical protein